MKKVELLAGCTPFPSEFRERYVRAGYWRGETLWDLLAQRANERPEVVAIVSSSRVVRYGELHTRAARLASALHALGLRAGDRVVVQLPNVVELVELLFALFRLGAIPVLALPAHRLLEIESFARQTEAVAYVVADREGAFDYLPLARTVRERVPSLREVIVVGESAEFVAFDALDSEPQPLPMPDAAQVALFQLSGGSTGAPKLIPRTHDDYLYSVRVAAEVCRLTADCRFLAVLPAVHNFPLSSPGVLGTLLVGGRVVLARTGTPDEAFTLIERERVTFTALVPPLLLVWLEAVRGRRADLSSLALVQVGGAKLQPEIARKVQPTLGCKLQQVFGMAEGLVCYTRDDDPDALVLTTQGKPASDADEVRVVDDDDALVADGVVGHLLTRGPYTVRGYYSADEHNRRAFTAEGFYRTGDLVRRLPSGHLVVEGRAKDQINRGGEKIAAVEVEAVLLGHPAVRDVALVAMDDPLLGERACAFVATHERKPGVLELNRYLREQGLATYKIPDRYEFVDQLPQTSVGKVDKKALRQRLRDAQTHASTTSFPSSERASP
jgi:2,3-dihydroxybenzoate-AMP ligase